MLPSTVHSGDSATTREEAAGILPGSPTKIRSYLRAGELQRIRSSRRAGEIWRVGEIWRAGEDRLAGQARLV